MMDSVAEKRRLSILSDLAENQIVRVSTLCERFRVSEVSIRRDLDQLERRGLLTRVRGGAVAVLGPVASCRPTGQARPIAHQAEKERIGSAASRLIQPGERLIFDSGTTVLEVARHLPAALLESGNLTIITSSLPVVSEIGKYQGTHLILLGGVYLSQFEVAIGPQTTQQLQALHADRVFMGSDGLTFSHGLTTSNLLEAEVDRAAICAASEIVAVVDSSKIGVIGLTTIVPLSRINILITDTGAPADFVADLREQGVQVMLV